MVKVVEQKQEKGALLCIYDIPENVMGSELDKFLCIAHLLLMGDEPTKHFYLQKLGLSTEPTGYAMFISNELMSGQVKFMDTKKAQKLVKKRFGDEYAGVGIKFAELLKEWLEKDKAKIEWDVSQVSLGMKFIHFLNTFFKQHHIKNNWLSSQDFQLGNLEDTRAVLDAIRNFGAFCTT